MSVADLVEMFSLPFMSRSLITVVVLALAGALIGVLVNLRDLEFISDGLAHSVFPGLVIGYVVAGSDGLFIGATVAALIGAALLTFVTRRQMTSDSGIAVVMASMFSLGIVIVSREVSYVAQLEQLLFGHLLTVTQTQLRQIVVVCVIAVVVVLVTWRGQLFRAFDAQGFRAAGYHELRYDLALNGAVALVVVAGSQAIGNLLILALLIVPVAIARLITTRLHLLAPIAAVASVLSGVLGLVIGYQASTVHSLSPSPSAVVVLVLIAIYAVVLVGHVVLRAVRLRVGRASGASRGDAAGTTGHDGAVAVAQGERAAVR